MRFILAGWFALFLSSCITSQGGVKAQKPSVGLTTLNPDNDPNSGNNELAVNDVSKDPNNNIPRTNPPVKPQKKSVDLNSFEVTVQGQVEIPKKCAVKASHVAVQLSDADDTILGSSNLTDTKKFNILASAHKGKLNVSVIDQSKNNRVIYSKEIFAGNNNQFEVNFILCL